MAVHPPSGYPVDIAIEPVLEGRNRLTTAFRLILAIPHILLVGASSAGQNGVLGALATACAVISWFAILFTGNDIPGLWDLRALYLRWRLRTQAYVSLLRDEYPPFGDMDYPATLVLEPPTAPRDRLSVGLRIVYAIPHIIVLAVLGIAAAVCTIISWFAILFTGNMPAGLAAFIRDFIRWSTRVEAYLLLMRDEYPPFSLAA